MVALVRPLLNSRASTSSGSIPDTPPSRCIRVVCSPRLINPTDLSGTDKSYRQSSNSGCRLVTAGRHSARELPVAVGHVFCEGAGHVAEDDRRDRRQPLPEADVDDPDAQREADDESERRFEDDQ